MTNHCYFNLYVSSLNLYHVIIIRTAYILIFVCEVRSFKSGAAFKIVVLKETCSKITLSIVTLCEILLDCDGEALKRCKKIKLAFSDKYFIFCGILGDHFGRQ